MLVFNKLIEGTAPQLRQELSNAVTPVFTDYLSEVLDRLGLGTADELQRRFREQNLRGANLSHRHAAGPVVLGPDRLKAVGTRRDQGGGRGRAGHRGGGRGGGTRAAHGGGNAVGDAGPATAAGQPLGRYARRRTQARRELMRPPVAPPNCPAGIVGLLNNQLGHSLFPRPYPGISVGGTADAVVGGAEVISIRPGRAMTTAAATCGNCPRAFTRASCAKVSQDGRAKRRV